jgi:outer membrane receptor protein involved in Fe transport
MHLGYTTPWHVHLTFAIQNLLDANSYEATVGKSSWTIPDIVYSGRTYSLKAGYTF